MDRKAVVIALVAAGLAALGFALWPKRTAPEPEIEAPAPEPAPSAVRRVRPPRSVAQEIPVDLPPAAVADALAGLATATGGTLVSCPVPAGLDLVPEPRARIADGVYHGVVQADHGNVALRPACDGGPCPGSDPPVARLRWWVPRAGPAGCEITEIDWRSVSITLEGPGGAVAGTVTGCFSPPVEIPAGGAAVDVPRALPCLLLASAEGLTGTVSLRGREEASELVIPMRSLELPAVGGPALHDLARATADRVEAEAGALDQAMRDPSLDPSARQVLHELALEEQREAEQRLRAVEQHLER